MLVLIQHQHGTDRQTDRLTEMVEQYRDLHANTMSCCRAKIN